MRTTPVKVTNAESGFDVVFLWLHCVAIGGRAEVAGDATFLKESHNVMLYSFVPFKRDECFGHIFNKPK